jgi:hypothetical protein
MLNKIKEFFTGKKPESKFAHPLDAVTTPYKVETPVTHAYDVPPAPGITTLLYVPPATEQAPVEAAPVTEVKEKAPAKAKAPKAAAKSKKV